MNKSQSNPERHLLTKAELAQKLALTPRGIDGLIKRKKIPVIRLGYRSLRFDWNAVQKALEKFTEKEI